MVQLQRIAADILHIIETDNTDITSLLRTVGDEIFRQSLDHLCSNNAIYYAIYDVAPKRKYEAISNTIASQLYAARRKRNNIID